MAGAGLAATLVVAGAGAAEIYYRHQVAGCVADQVQDELGSQVSVGFGPQPLLLSRFDHRIPYVDLDSDDARFGPAVDMRIHARLNKVVLSDGNRRADVGSSSAAGVWSDNGIAKTLSGPVTDVTSSAGTGIISVSTIHGLAHVQLRPHVVDHKIQVDVVSTRGLPIDLANGIVDMITQSLQSYPLALQADTLKVTDSGISFTLTGGPTTLQANDSSC